jgi:hypothetical protein
MFSLLSLSVCVGFVAVVYKLMGWLGIAGLSLMCGFTAFLMRSFK